MRPSGLHWGPGRLMCSRLATNMRELDRHDVDGLAPLTIRNLQLLFARSTRFGEAHQRYLFSFSFWFRSGPSGPRF